MDAKVFNIFEKFKDLYLHFLKVNLRLTFDSNYGCQFLKYYPACEL